MWRYSQRRHRSCNARQSSATEFQKYCFLSSYSTVRYMAIAKLCLSLQLRWRHWEYRHRSCSDLLNIQANLVSAILLALLVYCCHRKVWCIHIRLCYTGTGACLCILCWSPSFFTLFYFYDTSTKISRQKKVIMQGMWILYVFADAVFYSYLAWGRGRNKIYIFRGNWRTDIVVNCKAYIYIIRGLKLRILLGV